LEKELGENVGVVFCGDFNSVSTTAAVHHCLGMKITGNEIDMFSSGKNGIYKIENELEPPITFKSAITPLPGLSLNIYNKYDLTLLFRV